jgi:hypothetical protein
MVELIPVTKCPLARENAGVYVRRIPEAGGHSLDASDRRFTPTTPPPTGRPTRPRHATTTTTTTSSSSSSGDRDPARRADLPPRSIPTPPPEVDLPF